MSLNKLKIGEFSRLCHVTVRTLRHYEEIGLLIPDHVDEWTNYRYYSVVQFQKMQAIIQLKELGFSLEEIRDIFEEETHIPSIGLLNEKIVSCEKELKALQHRKKVLKSLIDFQKKKNKMKDITIETLPSIIVASYRTTIESYDKLGQAICEKVMPEMIRACCKCEQPGYCFTIDHNKEYRETNIDIEYCEQVVEKGKDTEMLKFKVLPEIPTAICIKSYGNYNLLPRYFANVLEYIEKEGYQISDSPRFNYVDGIWNEENPDKWLTIIQVPVKK
ncbi:MAG: MerR family transcriptional regulator [Candidatus Limimorpha sp.]